MFRPVSARLKQARITNNVNKSGYLITYECLFDIGLTCVSVGMWVGNADGQECKESPQRLNIA